MRLHLMIIAFALLAVPGPAEAWHKDGHMAVARIAWQSLDKPQRDAATKILKAHVHDGIDHYKIFLLADKPAKSNMSDDEWAFARAAAWPDWVRNPRLETQSLSKDEAKAITGRFHKGGWHFVNLPFVHPQDADQ